MNGRSPLERRLIALGLLALAAALVVFALVLPVAAGFADRGAQREQLSDDLARGKRLVGERAYWRDRLRRQRAEGAAFAVSAPNASAAAQAAIERIGAAVQAPGGQLKSLREQTPGPGEARLRLEAELSLTQLVASLKLLQGLKPYVVIENLSVAVDPTVAAGKVPPMDVRIDLAVPYLVASE